MKKILLGLATVGFFSAISFSACGEDPCSAKPKCSADPVLTAEQITACKAAPVVTTCKTERDAYGDCSKSNTTCGTDNKSDYSKVAAACKTQFDALTKCTTPAVDAGSGRDGG